jgi:hypothetical protein
MKIPVILPLASLDTHGAETGPRFRRFRRGFRSRDRKVQIERVEGATNPVVSGSQGCRGSRNQFRQGPELSKGKLPCEPFRQIRLIGGFPRTLVNQFARVASAWNQCQHENEGGCSKFRARFRSLRTLWTRVHRVSSVDPKVSGSEGSEGKGKLHLRTVQRNSPYR